MHISTKYNLVEMSNWLSSIIATSSSFRIGEVVVRNWWLLFLLKRDRPIFANLALWFQITVIELDNQRWINLCEVTSKNPVGTRTRKWRFRNGGMTEKAYLDEITRWSWKVPQPGNFSLQTSQERLTISTNFLALKYPRERGKPLSAAK